MAKCDTCKHKTTEDGLLFCDCCIHEPSMGDRYEAWTNAERIRAMDDEELGDLLRGLCKNAESCDFCPMHDSCPEGSYDLKPWLEWLQQPCEEGSVCST